MSRARKDRSAHPGPGPVTVAPATRERWEDLARLFGPRGACGGCWCMTWRLPRPEYERLKGEGTRRALRALVEAGEMPGLLAYEGTRPIGWCALAPRESYGRLERSRILKPVDERPVWSIVCLFVDRAFRRRGVTVALLRAAAEHARAHGGRILEGYPIEPKTRDVPPVFAFTGLASAFRKAGFREVARRSATRPIMRIELGSSRG